MEKDRYQRIEKMEQTYNEMAQALQNLEIALAQWEDKMPLYNKLLTYYTGVEWREDYEASNKADFPSPIELSHGVLAEDTIHNEMIKHREIAIQLLKTGTKMLEI